MVLNQIKFILFIIFSLFAVNFSTYYVVEFFDIDRAYIEPLLLYITVLGIFVIVLPKRKGMLIDKLSKTISSVK